MDSETLGEINDDFTFGRSRRTESRVVVYTRRGKKKAHKSCNNNGTATPCSTGDATSATNHASTVTGLDATDASPAAVSEGPNCCDTAAPLRLVINGGHAESTSPGSSAYERREQEFLEGTMTREEDSHGGLREQSPYQEEVLQRGSPDKGADSSGQQMHVEPQQQQQQQHEGVTPLLLKDENLTQNHGQEECGKQPSDEGLLHPGSVVDVDNLEKSLAADSANKPLQRSEGSPSTSGKGPIHDETTVSVPTRNETPNDGKLLTGLPQVAEGCAPAIANSAVESLVTPSGPDKIKIKFCKTTLKNNIMELRKKLELELDQIRGLVKQFESKESHLASNDHAENNNGNLSIDNNYPGSESGNIGGYSQPQSQPQHSQLEVADRRVLLKMSSEMGAMKHKESRPTGLARVNSDIGVARNLESRPYGRSLSIALMENNDQGIEKEKRTPKANQYYRNSEFLLGKDRLPPENAKRFKSSNGRKQSRETGHPFGFGYDKGMNRLFKSCLSLLQRLMKHKYAWVFNEPVDAKALGLIDYHDIIKHPMDLGTIKTRLAENWYKSAGEFAEDVRLVFHNAMTYNPKGQDVHVMAEQLLQIFEEKWAVVEIEYNPFAKYQIYQDGGLRTPPSRKPLPRAHLFTAAVPVTVPVPAFVPANGPTYVPNPVPGAPAAYVPTTGGIADSKIQRPYFGRTPAPKKPKAKDLNKRDMTYDEKQKLSTNLQGLPPEKLDAVIQIIKKRNTAMSQHDDEIEVDIDSVDTETLWELDRFITNYKKSLSKNKRKAELALQARMATKQNNGSMNLTPSVAEGQMKTGAVIEKGTVPPDNEKQGGSRSGSSSSNSSSSDSGSSSSDSDSDSSSADGSDAEHSQRA